MNPASRVKELRINVISDLRQTDHRAAAAQEARAELSVLKSDLSYRKQVFTTMYKATISPNLECYFKVWFPFFKKDDAFLEQVQQIATWKIAKQSRRQ